MTAALKRHGVDYELVSKPHWGHVFDGAGMEDPSVREAFDKVLMFLEKHVR
jgi:dipeptidyl aminopeptidase/acylaminoacyl peptidase